MGGHSETSGRLHPDSASLNHAGSLRHPKPGLPHRPVIDSACLGNPVTTPTTRRRVRSPFASLFIVWSLPALLAGPPQQAGILQAGRIHLCRCRGAQERLRNHLGDGMHIQ